MAFSVDYPGRFEDWWLRYALQQFSCDSLQDCGHRLEQSIQLLSDQFTTERIRLQSDYFSDPKLLAAYGLFFFPQTYVRTSLVLQEIQSRGWRPGGPISILDLGAGAGGATFGAASIFTQNPMNITAVDSSRNALKLLENLKEECPGPEVSRLSLDARVADIWQWLRVHNEKFDLILASFSLNEANFSRDRVTALLSRFLTERGIVVILEPASRNNSENLERWRDEIVTKSDLQIWGPCPHRRLCPLLQEGKFWCHEVRSWSPPSSLRFLNRHLHRQIHVLKFSFLAFGVPEPDTIPSSAFRLLSPVSKHKKSLLFTGCSAEGIKKDFRVSGTLTERERKNFHQWERGDIIRSVSFES